MSIKASPLRAECEKHLHSHFLQFKKITAVEMASLVDQPIKTVDMTLRNMCRRTNRCAISSRKMVGDTLVTLYEWDPTVKYRRPTIVHRKSIYSDPIPDLWPIVDSWARGKTSPS